MCIKMGRKSKAQKLIEGRVPGLPNSAKIGKLSPSEHGENIAAGKARKKGSQYPDRTEMKREGETYYVVRGKDGQFQDIQDPKLARSRDRRKKNQGTKSDY